MAANTNQFIDSATSSFFLADTASTSQDISACIRNCDFPDSWKNNDVTVFGSLGTRYFPSIVDTHFRLEMVFNQTTTTSGVAGSHTVVGAMHSGKTTKAFIWYPAGTTSGNTKISGNCSCPKYTIMSKVGDALFVNADFDVDNGITFGTAT